MNPNATELFKPTTRGDIIVAIDNDAISKIAPSSPRPVEMLESCEVSSDDKLTATDTALHELLISTAYMTDQDMIETTHTIPVSTVLKFFGKRDTHANRREMLKVSLKRLAATTVSYGTLQTRRYEGVPLLVSWLEMDESSDIIRYCLPQPIRELMRAMPEYVYLELAPLAMMKSKFSIRIYRVLAAAAVQRKWEPGADNVIALKATANEIAAWSGFPRDAQGDVVFGKLKERVLNGLEADLASVRRFKTKIVEVRKDVRGRPLDHIEFQLHLQAPSHHQTRVLFDAAEMNSVGGIDRDEFKVDDYIWLKAEKLFAKKLGFGHKQFFQLWQIALQEATTKVAQTPGYETRSYRGERLLSAIQEMGADETAWMLVAEEAGNPDLAHADAFVAFLLLAEKAEKARLARVNGVEEQVKGKIEQVPAPAPAVVERTNLDGVTEIVLTAAPELNESQVSDLIVDRFIQDRNTLGEGGCPEIKITIRRWSAGALVSDSYRPRPVDFATFKAWLVSVDRYLDADYSVEYN